MFQVQDFSMPLFMTVNNEGQAVSLSDHEALLGVYSVQERQFYNESLPRRALESHWWLSLPSQDTTHIDTF